MSRVKCSYCYTDVTIGNKCHYCGMLCRCNKKAYMRTRLLNLIKENRIKPMLLLPAPPKSANVCPTHMSPTHGWFF